MSERHSADYVRPWKAEDCCPLDHCNCPVEFHDGEYVSVAFLEGGLDDKATEDSELGWFLS